MCLGVKDSLAAYQCGVRECWDWGGLSYRFRGRAAAFIESPDLCIPAQSLRVTKARGFGQRVLSAGQLSANPLSSLNYKIHLMT